MQNVNNGHGFRVSFAATAQPGPVLLSSSAITFCAGYESAFALSGNFTIEINYSLNTWPANNGVMIGMGLIPFVAETRQSAGIHGASECYTLANGPAVQVPTTDMSGTMRLSLQGNTLTGSYWDASSQSWVVIGSATGFRGPDGPWPTTGPFQIYIDAGSDTAQFGDEQVVATISCISITADPNTILPGPYPLPSYLRGIPAGSGGSSAPANPTGRGRSYLQGIPAGSGGVSAVPDPPTSMTGFLSLGL
jgi:hypothetical protein